MEKAWEFAALAMSEKGTEISVTKDGFSFRTDGEASQRLANVALDFLSPITEGAGFLGTKLRGYRMESALKATIKAKEICEKNNLSINPVSPKFFLQWVEGASMEDVEDEKNLSNLWAQLLVSTSQNKSPNSAMYVDVLKRFSHEHVKFLESIMKGGSFESFRYVAHETSSSYVTDLLTTDKYNHMIGGVEPLKLDGNRHELAKQIKDRVEKVLFRPGIGVSYLDFFGLEKTKETVILEGEKDDFMDDKSDIYVPALVASGMLREQDIDRSVFNNTYEFSTSYVYLTQFGCELIGACLEVK